MTDMIQMPICKHQRPIKFGCTACYSEQFTPENMEEVPEDRQARYANSLDLDILREEGKKRDDIINQILHQLHDLTILVHNINQWIAAKEKVNAHTR